MDGLSLKQEFDELYEFSANRRIALEQEIAESVDVLGETYDAYIELSMKHEHAKKRLATLVKEFDESFADEASLGASVMHKGENYRALYEACAKKAVLSTAPEVLFNYKGLGVFSVSVKDCRAELSEKEFKSFFHDERVSRRLKSVSKYG